MRHEIFKFLVQLRRLIPVLVLLFRLISETSTKFVAKRFLFVHELKSNKLEGIDDEKWLFGAQLQRSLDHDVGTIARIGVYND